MYSGAKAMTCECPGHTMTGVIAVWSYMTAIFVIRQYDVTVEQFGVLAVLWYQDGINQKGIAESLNRDKTTITRIIETMLKRNLIVKVPDQLDGRSNLIFLTQKGKALQREMVESSGEVYVQALKDLSEPEVSSCLKVLKRIKRNLSSIN